MADLTGKVLGPYKLEQQLGRGGMATVWRAYQESVRRYVAIKVMSQDLASDPGFVERFTREAQLIAALQHPHILPVIDYGQADGIHYLVMNYISGGSLDDLMRKKQLAFDQISDLLGQISSALDYAHKKGVIHRDFKPNNVLLDGENNAYLTDFGIARLTTGDHRLTVTGTVMGTPAYMSPEQGTGKTVDARADLYSLGVVLYEMICGRLPFSGETPASLIFQHAFQPPPPPTQFRADIPPAVVSILIRAMAKNPDDRYQSGTELARAFDDALRNKSEPLAAPVTQSEDENTFIGTPSRGSVSAGTPPGTPAPGTIAPRPETFAPSPRTPQAPIRNQTPPPAPPPTGQPVAQKRSTLPVLIGAIAVIALIAGIGGGAVVIGNNNAAATSDTLTRVAIVALSATATASPTATNTPIPTNTATSTPTLTPSNTPLPSETPTPDAAATNVALQLTRLAQLEANFTATAAAFVQATQAAQANFAASQIAFLTRQAEDAIQTQTAEAQPTNTPRPPTATRIAPTRITVAPTRTPIPPTANNNSPTRTPVIQNNPYEVGTPAQIVEKLRSVNYLSDAAGVLWFAPGDVDVSLVEKENLYRWRTLGTGKLRNFVASAKFTWRGTAADSGCGLLGRYSQPSDGTYRFHAFKISAGKTYQVYTYTDTTDKVVKNGSVPLLNTGEGQSNHVLLIGQGDSFQLLVNGRYITQITLDDFEEGSVAVAAITGKESGLECSFTDAWVYELTNKGSGTITNNNDPDQIIKALVDSNEIEQDSAKLADQEESYTLRSKESDTNVFYRQALGDSTYRSFVFSSNITWAAERASTTDCGIHFYGTRGPDNLIAFIMYPNGSYAVYPYLQGKWSTTPLASGANAAIKKNEGESNRVTVIASGGAATIFVNGQRVTRITGITISRGNVGYYLGKGKEGGAESCRFTDSYVWNLTQ